MQPVRTPEYKWMVTQVCGELPDVSCFKMYDACREILSAIPSDQLHKLFNEAEVPDIEMKCRAGEIGCVACKKCLDGCPAHAIVYTNLSGIHRRNG